MTNLIDVVTLGAAAPLFATSVLLVRRQARVSLRVALFWSVTITTSMFAALVLMLRAPAWLGSVPVTVATAMTLGSSTLLWKRIRQARGWSSGSTPDDLRHDAEGEDARQDAEAA